MDVLSLAMNAKLQCEFVLPGVEKPVRLIWLAELCAVCWAWTFLYSNLCRGSAFNGTPLTAHLRTETFGDLGGNTSEWSSSIFCRQSCVNKSLALES